MHPIVLATADEAVRSRFLTQLAEEGQGASCSSGWADTLGLICQETTRLALIDARLDGASGEILGALARSLPHHPEVRTIEGDLPPLGALASRGHLVRLVGERLAPALSAWEQRLVELVGLGTDPVVQLQRLAVSPLPVRIQGERGTGKEWVARLAHRLLLGHRPFVVVRPDDEPVIRDHETPGTLFLEAVDQRPPDRIRATVGLAEATGWRLMAASRYAADPEREPGTWNHLHLRPLRERPKDLRPLVRLYVQRYRERLGLPERRVHASLWQRIERYPWPGNNRQLETFVVQAVTSVQGRNLAPERLPRRVLAMLDLDAQGAETRRAFEQVVEERLRPVVFDHDPDAGGLSLHRLVVDTTERALLRLALQRTGGNQKAAAELLGIARNTLRTRLERLDPFDGSGS